MLSLRLHHSYIFILHYIYAILQLNLVKFTVDIIIIKVVYKKHFHMQWKEFNPLQLKCAFMLPLPGDELWTDDFLNAWCKRWTKFNRKPYDDARKIKNHDNNNQQAKL